MQSKPPGSAFVLCWEAAMFYFDRTEAIRGFMPRCISLLQHMLACSDAERCQVPSGLTSFYDPDPLVLNVRKGSVKFGGLMKKICYILCYIKCFFFQWRFGYLSSAISDTLLKDWLRTFFLFSLSFCLEDQLLWPKSINISRLLAHTCKDKSLCHSIITIMWWEGECSPEYRIPKSSTPNALADEPSTYLARKDVGLVSQYVAWLWFCVWESLL